MIVFYTYRYLTGGDVPSDLTGPNVEDYFYFVEDAPYTYVYQFRPRFLIDRYSEREQDLTMAERAVSIMVDVQISFPGGDVPFPNELGFHAHSVGYELWKDLTGATNSVVVEYWTEDGGSATDEEGKLFAVATAGQDYKPLRGTLTFTQGSQSGWEYTAPQRVRERIKDGPDRYYFTREHHKKSVFFPIIHDNRDEPTEQFTVKARIRSSNNENVSETIWERQILLSNPTNAVIQPSTSRIEIVNDDQETLPPPVNVNNGGGVAPIIVPHLSQNGGSTSYSLMFRPTSLTLSESGSATYQVRATSSPTRDMVVNLATTHSGITLNPNRLTFYPINFGRTIKM